MSSEDFAGIEPAFKQICDCLDQLIRQKEHVDKTLQCLKAVTNHPLNDNAHTMILKQEDHIAENDQTEENSSACFLVKDKRIVTNYPSEAGHLEDDDEGEADLSSQVCHDIKLQPNIVSGFSTTDFIGDYEQ